MRSYLPLTVSSTEETIDLLSRKLIVTMCHTKVSSANNGSKCASNDEKCPPIYIKEQEKVNTEVCISLLKNHVVP